SCRSCVLCGSGHGQDRDSSSVSVDNGAGQPVTLAVTPGQVNACAPQSGNCVFVSCSDSAHSAAAVAASLARRLRPTGWVRPTWLNLGPTNVSPGRSCDAAYNVCRAPNSASVANTRVTADISASPSLRPEAPCRLVCE